MRSVIFYCHLKPNYETLLNLIQNENAYLNTHSHTRIIHFFLYNDVRLFIVKNVTFY